MLSPCGADAWSTLAERGNTIVMNGVDYVTLTSAADTANVPAGTLRQWIESGKLPATTSDRGRLVRLVDVWRLIDVDGGASPGASPVEAVVATEPASTALDAVSRPVRRRQRGAPAAPAAYIAKLDELYRAQIVAKDDAIATKDELIGELRRRVEQAEQQIADMERRLAGERTAEMTAPSTPPPTKTPGLLARLLLRYAQR